MLSPTNLIQKRIELVPIGLDETIKSFNRGDRKKIIWREVGFIKYFNRFKKIFNSFKSHKDDLKPNSMRWVREFLEILQKLVTDIIEVDKKEQRKLQRSGADIGVAVNDVSKIKKAERISCKENRSSPEKGTPSSKKPKHNFSPDKYESIKSIESAGSFGESAKKKIAKQPPKERSNSPLSQEKNFSFYLENTKRESSKQSFQIFSSAEKLVNDEEYDSTPSMDGIQATPEKGEIAKEKEMASPDDKCPSPENMYVTPEKSQTNLGEDSILGYFNNGASASKNVIGGLSQDMIEFPETPDEKGNQFRMNLYRCEFSQQKSTDSRRRSRKERLSSAMDRSESRHKLRRSLLLHSESPVKSKKKKRTMTPNASRSRIDLEGVEQKLKEEEGFIRNLLEEKLARIRTQAAL